MKTLAMSFSLTLAAIASLSLAPRAEAGGCAAELYEFELAVDTANYICGSGNVTLCAYAQERAIDAGRDYIECELRESGDPQT